MKNICMKTRCFSLEFSDKSRWEHKVNIKLMKSLKCKTLGLLRGSKNMGLVFHRASKDDRNVFEYVLTK